MAKETERLVVVLGNDAPRNMDPRHTGPSETRVELWPGVDDKAAVKLATAEVNTQNDRLLVMRSQALAEKHAHYAIALHEVEELWPLHSDSARPAYVSSNDPEFQKALADYYGCPEGTYEAIITNAGRDALHTARWGTSTQPAQFSAMGISTATSGFVAADTTLTSELTTNGLTRGVATFAHTTGATTSTLTKTWTYTGSGSVVIGSVGTFNNAASGGTLGEEDVLSGTITVTTSGDTATVTFTATTS